MNKANSKRINVFIGILVMLALLAVAENWTLYLIHQKHAEKIAARIAQQQEQENSQAQQRQQEQQRQQGEIQEKASEAKAVSDAAEEHARYVAQYTDTNFVRKPDAKTVAVMVASESGTLNSIVCDALVSRFKDNSFEMVSPFFKPAFLSDGLFNDAFNGSSELFGKLDLAKSIDALLLAREDVQYSSNPALENIVTANLRLDVVVLPVAGGVGSKRWTFNAIGAGVTSNDARQLAEERLIKQISNDNKMSLSN
jgi:hypothetical protein